jgi:hypothetical protein
MIEERPVKKGAWHRTSGPNPQPWTCPTCSDVTTTHYCPRCGERRLAAHELTLRGLGAQIFNALTSVDGKLIRSVICLFGRPGYLTVA